jgi:hypothetical protein
MTHRGGNETSIPPALLELVSGSVIDAELGALLWTLLERGVPALVIGGSDEGSLSSIADAVETLAVRPASREQDATRGPDRPVRTLRATSLQDAFGILADDPFHLTDDAVRSLGVVLVVRDERVVAAHYLRPVERDREGHLQRRPPAVLATWDEASARFEHFAWAVTPELAFRSGMTQAELEELVASRRKRLSSMGVTRSGQRGSANSAR